MSGARSLVDLLPHRPPMRLVDTAEMGRDGVLEAAHTVPTDSPILAGHFPGFPLWPGNLLVEAMAQTAALYLLHLRGPLADDELPVLGATEARFFAPVFPGDRLRFRAELVRRLGDDGRFLVRARRGGVRLSRARIDAGIRRRSDLPASFDPSGGTGEG